MRGPGNKEGKKDLNCAGRATTKEEKDLNLPAGQGKQGKQQYVHKRRKRNKVEGRK